MIKLSDVKRLKIKRGDILVVTAASDLPPTAREIEQLGAWFAKNMPGVRVMVVQHGQTAFRVRREMIERELRALVARMEEDHYSKSAYQTVEERIAELRKRVRTND